jgi:hypothetical protein
MKARQKYIVQADLKKQKESRQYRTYSEATSVKGDMTRKVVSSPKLAYGSLKMQEGYGLRTKGIVGRKKRVTR